MHRYVSRIARCVLALSCFAAAASHADTYPDRPIKLVVPFPPGGGSDAVGRLIAKSLSENLGQQVVVDNRGGAGGSIGTGSVARATPDGYTLVLASTSEIAINPSLYPSLGYSTINDLTPVAMVATTPLTVAVNPELKVKTLQELVALVGRQPGKINVASAGTGTITHLSSEMYRAMNDLNWVHVPYKGTAPALADLVSGQVQIMFLPPPPVLGLAQSGRVRLLAVSGKTRAATLPDVPTVMESGTPEYTVDNWYGVFAPHGTPAVIVDKLSAAVGQALKQKEVIDALALQGAATATLSRAQFADYVKREAAKWGNVVRSSSAKVE
ncbi:MAG TPA: tripartite tricarboxylate transporter substrate binding protein [Bordetella sp.]|nr:tripartite tricarboxylate transporter substrate binding protein [Bordetella sp.]